MTLHEIRGDPRTYRIRGSLTVQEKVGNPDIKGDSRVSVTLQKK